MIPPSVENVPAHCELIVRLIQQGDVKGEELLYTTFAKGLRYLAARHYPADTEDCMHDTVLAAICQIRAGQLQKPAALPAYLTIVLKRTAWNKKIQSERVDANSERFAGLTARRCDAQPNPQQLLEIQERAQILQAALKALKPQEREILTRFYLQGEKPEWICQQMQITENQFRLWKCRSKKKLEALAKQGRQQSSQSVPLACAS